MKKMYVFPECFYTSASAQDVIVTSAPLFEEEGGGDQVLWG